ncbi:hypothetical protein AAC387_Pa01g3361 [Persea americana]
MANGLEWRVVFPNGSSQELVPQSGWGRRAWMGAWGLILGLRLRALGLVERIWKLGVDDPRRVVHGLKVGISLTLVSLFYYMRPLYDGVGGTAMWAVMTVVVVFEFTVGATLSKGLNRGMATLIAGSLAIGIHWIANQLGDQADPIIQSIALFLLASVATFSRFIPIVKTRFDYGVTIFILTFSLVSVSGYRVEELVVFARNRLYTIAIGGSICMLISMLICPNWAGGDLHQLITRNMEKLACSLEGCVSEYFEDSECLEPKEEPCQGFQGYKCVLNSKATEEALANFARWEPAHGCFSFRHPWKQYIKIGTVMRHCAYCVEALDATINSDNKAPEFIKKHFREVFMRMSSHSSNVLRELAVATKTMRKSSSIDLLVEEMKMAVGELQRSLRYFPHQLTPPPIEATEDKRAPAHAPPTHVPFMEVLPLVTAASLLIEIAVRIEGLVDAVDELAGLANFKPAIDDKPKHSKVTNNPPQELQGQETMKVLQQV